MEALPRLMKAIKNSLDDQKRKELRLFQALKFRTFQHVFCRLFLRSNLKALARFYNSDKWGEHWYAQHYEAHFRPFRRKKLTLLEIGIGGYDSPELGGGSLRMWRAYFPKARVAGIDIYNKQPHDEKRIKTFQGSQVDTKFLDRVIETIGEPDLIIDDGSHLVEHVIQTFHHLFPKLKTGGMYVIEDLQTSYWQDFGGTSHDLQHPETSMGLLKQLVDGLNYMEYEIEDYAPKYFDKHIVSCHFYHNLAFIQKGHNDERSPKQKELTKKKRLSS